jgi:3-deoxy-D-manno-octulosonic-acid transferase
MLWLYRILFVPALLVLAPRYLGRMRKRGGYRENFAHRFGSHRGLPSKRPGVRRIWFQAVSVGEMLAIGPILEQLARDPSVEIYLTTTTSTGYALALERYRTLTIGVGYFPIDWWPFSRRAWKAIAPDLVILTEGERWPEHLRQARRRGVRVLCINGRLSDRSRRRLNRFPFVAHLLFDDVSRLLACSDEDARHFREVGVSAEKLTVTGNIKLDLTIAPLSTDERAQLRRELGLGNGLVLLGSSTWPGEEDAILRAFLQARTAGVECSLLIVPRHAERRSEVEQVLRDADVRFHFRSRGAAPGEVDVAVGDTTGELRRFTQLADLVFVGKSLPPNEGGQTPVEAAALQKPILFGPSMSNFRVIARDLSRRGAALEVADATALVATVTDLLRDRSRREALASAASQWQRDNSGAVARTLAVIRDELGR